MNVEELKKKIYKTMAKYGKEILAEPNLDKETRDLAIAVAEDFSRYELDEFIDEYITYLLK
jgi:hypothetical protein